MWLVENEATTYYIIVIYCVSIENKGTIDSISCFDILGYVISLLNEATAYYRPTIDILRDLLRTKQQHIILLI
jgi:hypothetical protein